MLYLDTAATTPVSPRVADKMREFLVEDFGNAGSRTHLFGQSAKKSVSQARSGISQIFGVSPEEVIFTSGSTESNNIAILGLRNHLRQKGNGLLISSPTEHKSVLEPLGALQNEGFELNLTDVNSFGEIDLNQVVELASKPNAILTTLMHVNNETGVINPIEEMGGLIRNFDCLFHVDASQGFLKFPDMSYKNVDLVSISAHKVGGPKGIGALIMRRRGWQSPPLSPLMYGGGQERNLRPGTLPVHLIMGFWEAIQERLENFQNWQNDTRNFEAKIMRLINDCGGKINGNPHQKVPGIINVYFPGVDSEALVLGLKNIVAIATGSACTSSEYTPSHVLSAMKLSSEAIEGSIRISWSGNYEVDLTDFEHVVNSLKPAD